MNTEVFNKINEDGIVKIKNFLNKEELIQVRNIVKYYSVPKNHIKSYFSTRPKHLIFKVLKFNFVKLIHDLKILKLARRKNLNKIANKVFKKNTYLNYIDGYYSKVSEKDVLPWHTDQAYKGDEKKLNGFVNPDHTYLKFFIYLTDVDSNNGCMSYIPKSHKLGYAIRKGIFEGKINYQPYWSLKEFRNFILDKKNLNYIKQEINQPKLIENFLNQTDFVKNEEENYDFDYKMSAGDAIIFNEGGVHKGSKTLLSDRMVLRYLYSINRN